MPELFRFSALARTMRPSPIRELFKLIQRPGMISFAGGLPDPAGFPVASFAACADVLASDGAKVLQYGASEGYEPLRAALLDLMAGTLNHRPAESELLITSGSQQAADLVARALLDPGDVVVVEAPTYPGTLHSLRNVGARFAAVPCDGDGMQVERLPAVVDACVRATGQRPKLIYTIPDFANPSGACLSLARRHTLLELARELAIPIFEDDPYGRLRYHGEAVPTVKSLAGADPTVIYASSFSKILAPGVRVAWTVADATLIRSMVLLRQGEDLCTSTVTQALVAEYCRRDLLARHLQTILAIYSSKCRAMQAALACHVPRDRATWHEPQGGFFFWLNVPGRSSQELFLRAVDDHVAFVPGLSFYPSPDEQVGAVATGDEYIRLCFTFADQQQIDEGCRRLGRVLADA